MTGDGAGADGGHAGEHHPTHRHVHHLDSGTATNFLLFFLTTYYYFFQFLPLNEGFANIQNTFLGLGFFVK
jgi:hypothetical protein